MKQANYYCFLVVPRPLQGQRTRKVHFEKGKCTLYLVGLFVLRSEVPLADSKAFKNLNGNIHIHMP